MRGEKSTLPPLPMHTENEILIRGDRDRIFTLAAAIGDWPRLLPHYRWVRVLADDGRVKQAEMAARRGRFPVRWRTAQIVLREEHRIVFVHTGGVTRGMYVEWRLRDTPDGVRVTISHDLAYPLPFATNWFARHVVGGMFVHPIAGRTLAHFKEIVERDGGKSTQEGTETR